MHNKKIVTTMVTATKIETALILKKCNNYKQAIGNCSHLYRNHHRLGHHRILSYLQRKPKLTVPPQRKPATLLKSQKS